MNGARSGDDDIPRYRRAFLWKAIVNSVILCPFDVGCQCVGFIILSRSSSERRTNLRLPCFRSLRYLARRLDIEARP